VQKGEWLGRIAANCNVDLAAIVDANPGLNPNLIYAGQLLNMPDSLGGQPGNEAPVATEAPPTPAEATAPVAETCSGTHVVAAGENLFRIGYNCGISLQKMATANDIGSPYTIYPGQTLRYP